MRASVGLFVLLALPLSAQTYTADFTGYPDGSDGRPQWDARSVGFEVVDGVYTSDSGIAIWREVPFAAELVFSADLTVTERFGPPTSWGTAGLGIQFDDRNYWALHLVMSPVAQGERPFPELQQRLADVWLSQSQDGTRLASTRRVGEGFAWEYGRTYRLELRLNTAGIEGDIHDGQTLVTGFGYRFDGVTPAVVSGRPVLRASGLKVRFDNARCVVTAVAPEPVVADREVPTWTSRPGSPIAAGTGYFRPVEVDGRWWLVDPEGKPFYVVGTDHCRYGGHWAQALGYAPYGRVTAAKFGSESAWAASATDRLKLWNFNTLAAGHSPSTRHRGLAHILFASFGSGFARLDWICEPIHWTGFPNVFSPRWERFCQLRAKEIAREAGDDPWMIGTFLDNELEWYGKQGFLVDEIFKLGPDHTGKLALWEWLVGRYGEGGVQAALGADWGSRARFLANREVPVAAPAVSEVREGFLTVIAERYFAVASGALKAADPLHLNLGCRFAGRTPEAVLEAAGRHCDVFTINTYPRVDLNERRVLGTARQLTEYYQIVKRPMILTEWSFPALDSGLPCQHGAGMRVDTQEQKAECYEIFANMIADLPFMVGYHYFMWVDEPKEGISDTFPEDSNYGLVDVNDEPYEVLVAKATTVNAAAAARHEQSVAAGEFTAEAVDGKLVCNNPGPRPAVGQVTVGGPGETATHAVRLQPGESVTLPLVAGASYLLVRQWDGETSFHSLGADAAAVVNTMPEPVGGVPVLAQGLAPRGLLVGQLAGGVAAPFPAEPAQMRSVDAVDLRGGGTTWRCQVGPGSLCSEVSAEGLSLGWLDVALRQRVDGQNQWVAADHVVALEVGESGGLTILDAVVERRGDGAAITAVGEGGVAEAPRTGPAAYRAKVRLAVTPDLPVAVGRFLWVESLDPRPWELVQLFWFVRPRIGGDSADVVKGGPSVPNYYLRAEVWTDRVLGGAYGAAPLDPEWRASFWVNAAGGFHPDVYRDLEVTLRPVERADAVATGAVWFYGCRELDNWRAVALQAQVAARLRQIIADPTREVAQ